jgi:hypothetical protein
MTTNNLKLCEIQPADLAEFAQFIQSQMSPAGPQLNALFDRLRWILLENPVRDPAEPLGWFLRGPGGKVAGCMGCTPQKFAVGETICTVMVSTSFYVDPANHGAGTSIFLKFLQMGRRYPLLVSSASPTVATMWQKLGAYSIGRSGQEILGILNWKPVLEEALYRKSKSAFLGRAASALVSPVVNVLRRPRLDIAVCELQRLNRPEEAASLGRRQPPDRVTSLRDSAYLKWRYFSTDPTTRAYAFRASQGAEPHLVTVNLRPRGYKGQITALHVLDIWGAPAPELYSKIAACLAHEYRDQIDMIAFRCLGQAGQEALQSKGFVVRSFAAPIAWCIDKFGLLPSKQWYLVPADGDMVF